MKEQWHKLKEWHAQLETRERRIVSIGVVVIVFAIIYFAVWSPLMNSVDTMRSRLAAQQKTLAWMQDAELKIQALSGNTSTSQRKLAPVAMLSLLQKEIDRAGLRKSMTQLKQSGNSAVQMEFKNAAFDKLVTLVMTVMKSHDVKIAQFNATAQPKPGQVNALVVMDLNG